MSTQVNPFQSPPLTSSPLVPQQAVPNGCHFEFSGELTLDQFLRAHATWRPKKSGWLNSIGWAVIPFFIFAAAALDAVWFGEMDYVLEHTIAVVCCVIVIAAYYAYSAREKANLRRLANGKEGVFAPCRGHIQDSGVRFLANGFPIDYEWDDFVGYQTCGDILLLFVDYPRHVNFLAADWFTQSEHWSQLRAIVQAEVPHIASGAKRASRDISPSQALIREGTNLLDAKKWDKAVVVFDQLLAMNPKAVIGLTGKAVSLTALGRFDEAMPYSEQAIEAGASDSNTYLIHAKLLVQKGAFRKALPFLDALLGETPDHADLLRDRGLAYLKTGETERALADTHRSIQLNSQDGIAMNNRGAIFLELQQPEKAIADLNRAIELLPGFDRPKELLAQAQRMAAK